MSCCARSRRWRSWRRGSPRCRTRSRWRPRARRSRTRVNGCARAVLLAAAALAGGGEVVVSGGQLVEIGGSFRVPDVVAQSGARLVEVGTTNRTRLSDYRRAIGPETGAVMRAHPSNFRTVGFVEEVEI